MRNTESVNKRSWDDIVDALKEVPEYCDDPQFEEDGILDVLTVYESHLADLDQRAERQRARTAQLSRRKYRKTREAFLGMMQELEQQGRIHADSLWRSVYPDIAEVWQDTRAAFYALVPSCFCVFLCFFEINTKFLSFFLNCLLLLIVFHV